MWSLIVKTDYCLRIPKCFLSSTNNFINLFYLLSSSNHCVKSVRIRSYSVRMRENADQNNSVYGHFLRSEFVKDVRKRLRKMLQKDVTKYRNISFVMIICVFFVHILHKEHIYIERERLHILIILICSYCLICFSVGFIATIYYHLIIHLLRLLYCDIFYYY